MSLKNKLPVFMVARDIMNYIDWIKTINREKVEPNSMYNKFKMKHNFFYVIYFPIKLNDEDSKLPMNIKKLRIVEILAPVHRYIDEDLQFAEYIVPEFNQFYDDENNPTEVYGIVYRFMFKRLSLKWFITRFLGISVLAFVFIKFKIIQWLISLI